MATVGNVSSASANNATVQWVHTLGTGSNLVLVVGVCIDAGLTITSVTWDADGVDQALTGLRTDSNPGDAVSAIYYLVGPSVATGSSEVTVITSTKAQNIAGAVTFIDADTPDGAVGSVPDSVESVSDTVVSPGADDFVFDCMRSPGGAITEGASQTAQWNIAAGGERGGGSTQDGVDGGVMSWSWSGAAGVAHTACRIPNAVTATASDSPTRKGDVFMSLFSQ